MILTAGKDNKIKIWTVFKTLLYEINIDATLQYAVWSSKMNLILSQNNKIYSLRNIPFIIKQKEMEKCYLNFIEGPHD